MFMDEEGRLEEPASRGWKRWGPYLSERQWGTVREDYSPGGKAWDSFSHDMARSRAYRWGEDGICGICDNQQILCFALALWNGRDPILKERLFGLTNSEGNHGEDVKECYYYLDATPTHSYLKALYKYPQQPFPYAHLVDENRRRGREEPELELIDTGVFDGNRYYDVVTEYAKSSPSDILIRITVHNRGPDAAELHLLPQLWFRNRWSWGYPVSRPELTLENGAVMAADALLGMYRLFRESDAPWLFTENETNAPAVRPAAWAGALQGRLSRVRRQWRLRGRRSESRDEGRGSSSSQHRGRQRGGAAAAAVRRHARPAVRGIRRSRRSPAPGGGRFLRSPAARAAGRPAAGAAAGDGRHDLEQAVLLLRRAAVAEGRSRAAAASAGTEARAESRLGSREQRGRHLDARQVGIPVVRRVGSRVPYDRAGAGRSGVRETAAGAADSRMVHASERPAARLRVGVRRRQPAGPWVGRLARVSDRPQAAAEDAQGRPRRSRLSRARVPQADDQLHLVGQPEGCRGPERVPGRIPGSGQHRRLRPQRSAADGRLHQPVGRHELDGDVLPQPDAHRPGARAAQSRVRRHRHQVLRALPPHCRSHDQHGRRRSGSGTKRTDSSTTCSICRMDGGFRSRSGRWSA